MKDGSPITGILFELRTTNEGTWWASTLEGALACAMRRTNPLHINVLYQSHVAQIVAGERISLSGSEG
jgi:hypothetical protein